MGKTLPFVLLVLILFSSVVFAVDPEGKPEETSRTSDLQRDSHEGAPLPFPEQMVAGEVTGPEDRPLGGVMVKLFADGRLVEVTHTTSTGAYENRLPLNVEADETVVLWFIATTDNLLPQCVIIKKSEAAKKANIFSRCTPEVAMRPQMRVDVKLMTQSGLAESLKAKGCL